MRTFRAFCGASTCIVLGAAASQLILVDTRVAVPNVIRFEPNLIPIISATEGRVRKTHVVEASIVHVGDPLIELGAEELLRKKRAIESRIHFVELEPTSSRLELRKLYSELEDLQLKFNDLTITSEVDGEIVFVAPCDAGKELAAGSAVAVVRKQKRR